MKETKKTSTGMRKAEMSVKKRDAIVTHVVTLELSPFRTDLNQNMKTSENRKQRMEQIVYGIQLAASSLLGTCNMFNGSILTVDCVLPSIPFTSYTRLTISSCNTFDFTN